MWPGRRIKPLDTTRAFPGRHHCCRLPSPSCANLWLLTELRLQFLIIPANHLCRGCDAPAMHLSMTDSLLLRGLQRTPLSQKDSKEAASTTPLPGGLHHWPMTIEGIASTARASRREWGTHSLFAPAILRLPLLLLVQSSRASAAACHAVCKLLLSQSLRREMLDAIRR